MLRKLLPLLLLPALFTPLAARAQAYSFTDGSLGAYKQDFNTLTGNVAMTGNYLTSLPEVYAQATFPGTTLTNFSPSPIYANDGSNSTAYYYHFGYGSGAGSTDRALGGIAGTSYTAAGIGYVGIRLKNNSSATIRNLEVQYAMEQWYNSGRQDAARVSVDYQTGSSVTSLLTGTWTPVAALGVDAPSTATVVASRDGNSAANRRVRQATLTGLNLLPGQEIMLRWGYALNSDTNGNGLSIDDVVVTPETNVFYSNLTDNLDQLGTWNSSLDGTGTAPASFTADNQVFYVRGTSAAADRITTTGSSGTLGTWTVSGLNSKVVVGVPASAVTGAAATPAVLRVEYNKDISTGTIDVAEGSRMLVRRTSGRSFGMGVLHASSTVQFDGGTTTAVPVAAYGNLVLTGGGAATAKTLAGSLTLAGYLKLGGASLSLASSSLTLIRRDSLNADGTLFRTSGGATVNANRVLGASAATGYVVTAGTGRLRLSVPSNGVELLFPVGYSASSYTPVRLRQTAANSEDIFAVRVADKVYATYNLSTQAGTGTAITYQNVNKTWWVDEEVAGGSSVTMSLQWPSGEATSDFDNSRAHLNHYYASGGWDTCPTGEWGATATTDGGLQVSRSGITSFSPFAVSSRASGTLPVTLVAFTAQRNAGAVACAWTTASESNSRSFGVERSLDGRSFMALGTVAAAASSASTRTYSFVDAHPAAALAYYRLRQLDQDGREAFSPVVAVAAASEATAGTRASATPNPSAGLFIVAADADITGLEVVNALGQLVLQPAASPTPTQALDLSAQPAGFYLLRLRTTQGTQVVRVVKQ